MNTIQTIKIRNLEIKTPIYLPDATRGVVKGIDSGDLKAANIEGVVVNTYHLAETLGINALTSAGGIKNFMKFDGLVVSDSGGWQIFSLIHRNKNEGKITDDGVVFTGNGRRKQIFTPEKSIRAQFAIGSDIIICLDDFTSPDAAKEKVRESVERTILWAKKSKEEYLKVVEQKNLNDREKPALLAVIQGGWDKEMRKYCAEKLVEIGFDGYGFGGYAIDENRKLDPELSQYIADLIPNDKIKFALGVGRPHDIAMCSQMGWEIFDCTLPTRDARHQRLYTFAREPKTLQDLLNSETYNFIYINKGIFKDDYRPISALCDCYTCKNYSKAYLHHLFKIKDTLALRLAVIHNLRHYSKLTECIRSFTERRVL